MLLRRNQWSGFPSRLVRMDLWIFMVKHFPSSSWFRINRQPEKTEPDWVSVIFGWTDSGPVLVPLFLKHDIKSWAEAGGRNENSAERSRNGIFIYFLMKSAEPLFVFTPFNFLLKRWRSGLARRPVAERRLLQVRLEVWAGLSHLVGSPPPPGSLSSTTQPLRSQGKGRLLAPHCLGWSYTHTHSEPHTHLCRYTGIHTAN